MIINIVTFAVYYIFQLSIHILSSNSLYFIILYIIDQLVGNFDG